LKPLNLSHKQADEKHTSDPDFNHKRALYAHKTLSQSSFCVWFDA